MLLVVHLNNVQEKLNYILTQKFIMLLVDARSIAFDNPRWWFVCLFVSADHLVSSCEFHILACVLFMIKHTNKTAIFVLVVGSFLRKITTMIQMVAAAHKSTKEPGGTMLVIGPTLMACILMVHIPLLPMALTGTRSEVTIIL